MPVRRCRSGLSGSREETTTGWALGTWVQIDGVKIDAGANQKDPPGSLQRVSKIGYGLTQLRVNGEMIPKTPEKSSIFRRK